MSGMSEAIELFGLVKCYKEDRFMRKSQAAYCCFRNNSCHCVDEVTNCGDCVGQCAEPCKTLRSVNFGCVLGIVDDYSSLLPVRRGRSKGYGCSRLYI